MNHIVALFGWQNKHFFKYIHDYRTLNKVNKFMIAPRFERVAFLLLISILHYVVIPGVFFYSLPNSYGYLIELFGKPHLVLGVFLMLFTLIRVWSDTVTLKSLLANNKFSFFEHTVLGLLAWWMFDLKIKI